MSKAKPGCLIAVACLTCHAFAAAAAAAAFDFQDVARVARQVAEEPWEAPPTVPEFLRNLSYDAYRDIRFRGRYSLWHESGTNFQVMLVAPGLNYHHPVQIKVVDADGVHPVPFRKAWFAWPEKLAAKVADDLGYAGLKLTYPLHAPEVQNQFLVFVGASYFRGVARDQNFGLSARGIAIDTGLAKGEEFPAFTRFWLVRPSPDATAMKLYALLDGPSLAGAYQFVVYPGAPLRIEVRARLFVRQDIQLLGMAPLTSMFQYGANTPRPEGAWRPAVHDSGGLLVHAGTGEWLWRPLVNPATLQNHYFSVDSPKGFGLMQRQTRFAAYQDAQARYDRRPSAWVEPLGDWGKGQVVLVEIPTNSEYNDNIVAFWSPADEPSQGDIVDLRYTLLFGDPDVAAEPMARALTTLVGHPVAERPEVPDNAYRIVVDFAGEPLAGLDADAGVRAMVSGLGGTRVIENSVRRIDHPRLWRMSLLVAPAAGKPLALRAYLKHGDHTLSETWSYSLPAANRFTVDD